MGLIFSMLRSDNQTLGITTEMEKKEPDEPGVARSEGATGEEPMGDEVFRTPIPLSGPLGEFFSAWVGVYVDTDGTYGTISPDGSIHRDCKPATDDDHVHHEQCTKLKNLYKGDPCGIAHAINCVFLNDVVQHWDIRTPEDWPRNLCSCSFWNKLSTAADTT